MNKSLFSALWLEKMAISLTIGLIVMVAALNIVASLILLVMEKSRDIAILKTMGASARSITADLHAAGADHRPRRDGGRRRRPAARSSIVLDRYKLIHVPIGRLPDVLRAVHASCRSTSRWSSSAAILDLLRRDDLSLAPGGEARPGAGA